MNKRDDDEPVEHDPTGMRDLLAQLPEPGPMPADLVSRINASLAREAQSGHVDVTARGGVSALEPHRRSRRRWQVLGLAAAVVGVIGLGGLALNTLPGGVEASLGIAGSADDSGAVADSGGADSQARAESSPGAMVVMTGHDYTAEDLGGGAGTLLTTDPGALPPVVGDDAGTLSTPVGARECADALGVPEGALLMVDVATVDGTPGAVLVASSGGQHTAYAVRRSCSAASPGMLAGPVTVTP
ncbi:MAG: hypothetical protein WBL35_08260 [Ornithinibacter sp.]